MAKVIVWVEKEVFKMGRWDFDLTIVNNTDRALKLIDKTVPWGTTGKAPEKIAVNESAKYNIYSPSGAAHGYEFTMAFRDEVPDGEKSYGTVNIYVDVPLSKDNHSKITTTGIVNISGWDGKLPERGHNFARTLEISAADL